MSKKWSIFLTSLSLVSYSIADDQQPQNNALSINITSKISVSSDCNIDDFLNEAKEDGKALTSKWAAFRGVTEIETTVDQGSDDSTAIRCSECGGAGKITTTEELTVDETITSDDEQAVKCGCGSKPKKSCSSCNKPKSSSCSSCSSCCK